MQDKEGPGLSSEDHTKAFLHLTHSTSHHSHALSDRSMALQNIFQHPLPVPVIWASLITCYISEGQGMVPIPQRPFHFSYNGLFLTSSCQVPRSSHASRLPHFNSPSDVSLCSSKKKKVPIPCMITGL